MDPPLPTAAHEHNKRAWDRRARSGERFTRPADNEAIANPLETVDGLGWLGGNIRDQRVLCLAAGGGKHALIYAAAGGIVTVVDISPAMLELDRSEAAKRGLHVRTVEASMDAMPMLADGEFDLVVHPVSTCYVPDVTPVYREVARVTRGGGVYISQHKQPTSLQANVRPSIAGYEISDPYYRQGPLPAVDDSLHREQGTLEYIHRWEELLGAMCRAGFLIEDLVEPLHAETEAAVGTFAHRSQFVAPYVRIKARRMAADGRAEHSLLLP